MYEEDFVTGEVVEIEVDGRKFKYRPVTAGQENDWLDKYMVIKDGKLTQQLDKLNQLKMRNIVEVPYSEELIQTVLGLEEKKPWGKLNHSQRWELLRKLKPGIFSKIIEEINKVDNPPKKKD